MILNGGNGGISYGRCNSNNYSLQQYIKKLGYIETPDKQEVLYNLYDGLKIQEEITRGKWELVKKRQ